MAEPARDPEHALKERQRATWAAGDYGVVASRIVIVAEELCEAADLSAGWRVLDVATGSGNAAIAAARRSCGVVGVDFVPGLLEHARVRAEAERLEVEFAEGDAERLPFVDASFDAVLSVFGVMFAPDQGLAAAEVARVCRPGGVIALASWTPEGYFGRMFRLMSSRVPPAAGSAPPSRWGDEAHLRGLFGGTVHWTASRVRAVTLRAPSVEEHVAFFRRWFGPTIRAFGALGAEERATLAGELVALAREFDRNRGCGAMALPAEYLESVAVRD